MTPVIDAEVVARAVDDRSVRAVAVRVVAVQVGPIAFSVISAVRVLVNGEGAVRAVSVANRMLPTQADD
jgi:hypothetical protein